MTRDQLEHAIRAACDVSGDDEVYVFGSQAVLGQYPDAPASLRRSMEVDVSPKNRPEAVDMIDAQLGELSRFHREFGFYVHGLPIEEAATLPEGWRGRAIPVYDEISTRGNTGWCVEVHDLAASKLAAFRDKDRDFVRLLLVENLIDASGLRDRILQLGLADDTESRLLRWLDGIQSELE